MRFKECKRKLGKASWKVQFLAGQGRLRRRRKNIREGDIEKLGLDGRRCWFIWSVQWHSYRILSQLIKRLVGHGIMFWCQATTTWQAKYSQELGWWPAEEVITHEIILETASFHTRTLWGVYNYAWVRQRRLTRMLPDCRNIYGWLGSVKVRLSTCSLANVVLYLNTGSRHIALIIEYSIIIILTLWRHLLDTQNCIVLL